MKLAELVRKLEDVAGSPFIVDSPASGITRSWRMSFEAAGPGESTICTVRVDYRPLPKRVIQLTVWVQAPLGIGRMTSDESEHYARDQLKAAALARALESYFLAYGDQFSSEEWVEFLESR